MAISNYMREIETGGSLIRKMFETGTAMKEKLGADKVYDFSIGNPTEPPPAAFTKALRDLTAGDFSHGYMNNAGFLDVRAAVARKITAEQNVTVATEQVIMTCGAAGALNIALKALINPGDEVIVSAPYFMEYRFYCGNVGAVLKVVPPAPDFDLDPAAVLGAITPKTKIVLLNSPNNPTGKIYSRSALQALANGLKKLSHPVYLLSDEPYRRLVYDNAEVSSLFDLYDNTLIAASYSKDLSLAGERIGWLALNPRLTEVQRTVNACVVANRILGFVNANALMQKAVAASLGTYVDAEIYWRKRDALMKVLSDIGYSFIVPEGAFYLFVKSPLADDVAFCNKLLEHAVIAVPGSAFGSPGYFRLAYCCADAVIENSREGFRKAFINE